MSFLPAYINNINSTCIGQVERLKDNTLAVEAKFLWTLPFNLEVLANNYWGLKAEKVYITNRVKPFCHKNDYLIRVTRTNDKKVVLDTDLHKYKIDIKNIEEILKTIENILDN